MQKPDDYFADEKNFEDEEINQEEFFTKVIVEGTRNVWEACSAHHVKRLIITSDIVTMTAVPHLKAPKPGHHWDETYQSEPERYDEEDFYARSKTIAEIEVWDLHKEQTDGLEKEVE